jgi:predicted transcriptional regulator
LKQKGVSRIAKDTMTILLVYQNKTIRSAIYKQDFNKTIKSLENYCSRFIHDQETMQAIILVVSEKWNDLTDNNDNGNAYQQQPDSNTVAQEQNKVDVSTEQWHLKLKEKYQNLQQLVDKNLPNLWISLELELSILRILNIQDCTLPFAGIVLGRPSSLKTVGIELFRKWHHTYYTDNFSAKAFVSHSTAVPKEALVEIDMLPKIKNKCFLTPELAPTFAAKDEDLIQVLGIMTRILDGHGYESDTGAHGHRGYNEEMMFTWIGAAVDIPHKVHKLLGTLGPKLYFLRLPKADKSEDEYLAQIQNDNFGSKVKEVQEALFDYLKWFEIGPEMTINKESSLPKMKWNFEQDDKETLIYIIRLARLLAHLRGVVPTWETKGTQGSDYAYTIATIEEPDRAITQLRNLARGHALSQGRNCITIEDIPLIVKVVLSTASVERVVIFNLLLAHRGRLTTSIITESLNTTTPTALRTMTELKALGLVDMIEVVVEEEGGNKKIILKPEFEWFVSEDFSKSREGFEPTDNSEHLLIKGGYKEKTPPTSQKIFEFGQATTTLFLQCLWCDFKSEIAFDMENHLYEKHRYDIFKKLQVEYLDIEDRIQYAMELIKKRSEAAGNANDDNNNESITATTKGNDKE